MKLLPTPPTNVRASTEDSLGHGMEAVLTLGIFVGLGWVIDSIVGTIPLFMVIMTVIGSIGVFARFYYSYAARMDEHEANRLAKLAGPVADSAGEAA